LPVIGLTADGRKIVLATATGPSSYTAGGFNIIVPELEHIHAVIYSSITGGYIIGGITFSDNTVRVVVHYYNYPAAAAGPSIEVPAGTDLSGQTVTLIVIGV